MARVVAFPQFRSHMRIGPQPVEIVGEKKMLDTDFGAGYGPSRGADLPGRTAHIRLSLRWPIVYNALGSSMVI